MARNLSVLIVDADAERRLETLQAAKTAGLDCAGEAAYGTEVMTLTAQRRPTVILLALEDPPLRGLATLEALQQQAPDATVIVYSSSANPALMRQAMRAGARDYIEQPVNARDLEDAIHTALAQEERKHIARWKGGASSPRGRVVTVAGAKSGTGKTAIAVNLAVALRGLTMRAVALVDADLRFGDTAAMLGMASERDFAVLTRGKGNIDPGALAQFLVQHPSGVDVLPADKRSALEVQHVGDIASALSESHDYAIIDAPAAMTDVAAACALEATNVLLVTSPDVPTLKDTATAMRVLESWSVPRERIELVVNSSARVAASTVGDAESVTGLQPTLLIPFDGRVARSLQAGIPLVTSHPQSDFARSIRSLAERIAGIQAPPRRSRLGTLLRGRHEAW
jgi:pilus assembly protein CpaE